MKPLLIALALCSCTTDPNAGMAAAKMTGQTEYVAFDHHGKPDSSAVFPFAGVYWTHHVSCGSRRTKIRTDRPMPLLIGCRAEGVRNVRWRPVINTPTAPLRNGCLPLAIAQQRAFGGRIVRVSETHVEWNPR